MLVLAANEDWARTLSLGINDATREPDSIGKRLPDSLCHLFEIVPPGEINAHVFSHFLPASAFVVHQLK